MRTHCESETPNRKARLMILEELRGDDPRRYALVELRVDGPSEDIRPAGCCEPDEAQQPGRLDPLVVIHENQVKRSRVDSLRMASERRRPILMPGRSIVTAKSWAEATDKDQARSRAEVETRNCPVAGRVTLSAPRQANNWTRYIP